MIEGRKLLVTGATGQVGKPVACALARPELGNEVWAAARFSDAARRAELEAAGVRCATVDLAEGAFDELPDDFDGVLHFAVARAATPDFDADLRANAEAVGLLMGHCRRAKAFLHCSTTGVYDFKGHDEIVESDPLGDNHRVMMPTYSISKIAAEAVARYAARQFGLPTIIARLNTPYGDNGGWMAFHLEMIKRGVPIPVHTDAPSLYTPIHEDDFTRIFPALLAHAKVPAEIVNVCGQEHVSIEQWCAYLGELIGVEPKFNPTEQTLQSVATSNAKMRERVGPTEVGWQDGLRRMVDARHPEWRVG